MTKHTFNISIDCPHCAQKIESTLNSDKRVEKAILDFNNKKLTVNSELS